MLKKQIIFKSGNSLAVSIPSKLVKRLGIMQGQKAESEINFTKGQILFSFPEAKQLPLLSSKN